MRPWIAAMLYLYTTAAFAVTDPFLWLEDVNGEKAMEWVRGQNTRSLATLQGNPLYKTFYDQALAIAQARDRVPAPTQIGGAIYNFWQDAEHERGLWRRTTIDDYRATQPNWTTVLDVDALAKAEARNLVFKGSNCREPDETICLLAFSDGGEDAITQREFDLTKNQFVAGGFEIPRSKQVADWEDENTLLVGTDWGPRSLTASGYPFIIKRLRRGQKLSEAVEIFRGKPDDVEVDVASITDGHGNRLMVIERGIDAFHSETYRVIPTGLALLPIPQKASIAGLVAGHLIVKIEEHFTPVGGKPIPAGSVISLDLQHLDAVPATIFAPGPRQSLEEVAVSKDKLLAAIYDNVRGGVYVYTPTESGWTRAQLALPENSSVGIASSSLHDNIAFLSVTGFLTPGSLFLADISKDGSPVLIKSSPARFDASGLAVEQFEAASSDGVRIPYFVVHPKEMKLDGNNPTLLYAYGGFQVSELPTYAPGIGKLWMERGGVYVLANIRGGGEFGPAWHEAALKTKRQTAYDDFTAVARDLIARRITSPRHLGIQGGSNGGLLMGVEFTQHPELWNAVMIQVPLLDMLRFEQISAGASWTGEYGSVANPEERKFLAGISPYDNLKSGVKYPEPFLFTTSKDDRVGPVHARKFAARMEAMGLPFLYYEATEGGHGAGVNARELAQERALEMTYLSAKLIGP